MQAPSAELGSLESGANSESPENAVIPDSGLTREPELNIADKSLKTIAAAAPAASPDEDLENDQTGDALSKPAKEDDELSVVTLDEAKRQIGEETLSALAEKFNGKLSEVRPVDTKDVLF